MKRNLTEEQVVRGKAFVEALRNNKKKATGEMRNGFGGRCCLCVALDTALDMGFEPPICADQFEYLPPKQMGDFYGWEDLNPNIMGKNATNHNDGQYEEGNQIYAPKSHAEIADLFEEEFPQLKD